VEIAHWKPGGKIVKESENKNQDGGLHGSDRFEKLE
jgi:hypothetical protein